MAKIARAALVLTFPVVCALSFVAPRADDAGPAPRVPSSQEVLSAQRVNP